jgi:16S rRNA (uracil1498-N3)-methyltransferase
VAVTNFEVTERLRASAAHVLIDDLDRLEVSEEDHHHLGRVLRLRSGDEVSVGDGRGGWLVARWTGSRVLDAVSAPAQVAPPSPRLTIAFTPTKGDRADGVVQKLTELGVDNIVPVLTARSVVRWEADRAQRQVERWRRIVRESVCQSRQLFVPEVQSVIELADLVKLERVYVAEPGGSWPLADGTTVVVGPEGGFTPTELSWASGTVGLPGGVLRADTAAVAVGVLLAAHRHRGQPW